MAYQRHTMQFVEPGLREKLMERHRQIGPMSQYHDLKTIDAFDVRDRIATLKPKLLLLRGLDDPGQPPEYEKEIHEAVAGLAISEARRRRAFPRYRKSGED